MRFEEYFQKIIKKTRKSGPLRKFKIRTILGNPNLSKPLIGDEKKDRKRRYKGLDGKFFTPKNISKDKY